MRKLRLVHLYPDRMNIYGDFGNIIALQQRLKWRNLGFEYIPVTAGERLPKDIDLVFIGGGQDKGQVIVAEDLQLKKSQLHDTVHAGSPALAICGGYQLFGDYFMSNEYGELPGISIFPVATKATSTRMIGNVELESDMFGSLVGFENHSGATELFAEAAPLGRVKKGFGNNPSDKTEGIVFHNAIGTYLHGSFLPKNPKVTDHLLQKAIEQFEPNYKLAKLNDELENLAHAKARKLAQ